MARAKINGVFKLGRNQYIVFCNREVFDGGWLGDKTIEVLSAKDELDAFMKGKDIVDDWNERDKAQRQAVRSEAKKSKGGG